MTRRRGLEAEIEALRAAGCERYSVPVAAIQNNCTILCACNDLGCLTCR
jgi:hypothetical protein